MPRNIKAGEAVARRRRVYFHCVLATDGMTPALSEAGGQPQVLVEGTDAWADAGIGPLVALGSGRYYAVLAPAAVATPGAWLETRYKGASTAEIPGDSAQVINHDPAVLDKAGYSLGAGGLDAISAADPGAPANHTTLPRMLVAVWRSVYKTRTEVRESANLIRRRFYANDNNTVNATQAIVASGSSTATGEAT